MTKHPHADEKRRPSLERQLEGAGLFVQDEASDLDRAKIEKLGAESDRSEATLINLQDPRAEYGTVHGPHRVGRRATAQDRAEGKARIVAGTKIAEILAYLRKAYNIGYTREQIATALGFKLQTVCGRVHDLLTRQIDGRPAPLVYEAGQDSTGAAYVFAFTPEALTSSRNANV